MVLVLALCYRIKAGNSPEYLAENTMNFIKAANERPEIGMAFTTFQATVPQRFMDIDKEKALKLGVHLMIYILLLVHLWEVLM